MISSEMDSQIIKSMNKVGAGIKYFQKLCPISNRNWIDGSRVVVADCQDSLLVAAQVQRRLEKGVADAQVDLIHRLGDDWAQTERQDRSRIPSPIRDSEGI